MDVSAWGLIDEALADSGLPGRVQHERELVSAGLARFMNSGLSLCFLPSQIPSAAKS
jgi:hypothetical protein